MKLVKDIIKELPEFKEKERKYYLPDEDEEEKNPVIVYRVWMEKGLPKSDEIILPRLRENIAKLEARDKDFPRRKVEDYLPADKGMVELYNRTFALQESDLETLQKSKEELAIIEEQLL